MWAYYAKDYSGWCLAFKRGVHKQSNISPIMPVIYVDDLLNPIETIDDSIYGNDPIETSMRKLFCTKHISWKFQKEWRICENKGACLPLLKIKSIYLGYKISKTNEKKILTYAKKNNFNFFKMFEPKFDKKIIYKRIS